MNAILPILGSPVELLSATNGGAVLVLLRCAGDVIRRDQTRLRAALCQEFHTQNKVSCGHFLPMLYWVSLLIWAAFYGL